MGTVIQGNGFSRNYRSVIDLEESTMDGAGSLYQENPNPVSGCDMTKVRQTILEHESVFRHQLEELHRLYARQKELMNEIRRREARVNEENTRPKDGKRTQNAPHSSPFGPMAGRISTLQGHPIQDARILSSSEPWLSSNGRKAGVFPTNASGTWNHYQASYNGDTKLSLGAVQTSSQSNTGFSTFDLYSRNNLVGDICLTNTRASANVNISTKDFLHNAHEEMSLSNPGFTNRESREEGHFAQRLPVRDFKAVSQRKSNHFGFEIDTDAASAMSTTLEPRGGPYSWIARSLVENTEIRGTDDDRSKDEKSKPPAERSFPHHSDTNVDQLRAHSLENVPQSDTLPWFLRKSKDSGNSRKGATNPYFMNLESLQNCSHNFFKKTETAEGTFETWNQIKEISEPSAKSWIDHEVSTEKISGRPAVHMLDLNCVDDNSKVDSYGTGKVDVDKNGQFENRNGFRSDLRHQIDLNLSLDEEVQPSPSSLLTNIQKIPTEERVLESEAEKFPEERISKTESTHDECDNAAAEVLLGISSYEGRNLLNAGAGGAPTEDTDNNCLKWFVEIISSGVDDESIPDGVDYFEYMTLKLEETKDEYRYYEPVVLKNVSDDEIDNNSVLAKRSQRGQPRRRRRLKDFQRDTLPGMVTLSRLEVSEDFQAFEEMTKDKGNNVGPSSRGRNGRGRKRLGAAETTLQQQAICQLEDISLRGWGKRTRRLPRQRCPNAFLSFAVKC